MKHDEKDRAASTVHPWRAALKSKGWTVAHLAAESGYSVTHVSVALREPRVASRALAQRIAEVLELEPATPAPSEKDQP